MKSIRRQLLLALLAAITLTTLLCALAIYRMAREEANTLFDYQLRQLALSFRDQGRQRVQAHDLFPDEDREDFSVQIWQPDGTLIYLSQPRQNLPHHSPLGFATVDTGNGSWRVFGLQQGGQTIQVAQPMQIRDHLALAAAWRTVTPFLLMLPLLGVLIWVLVGRGLRPLDTVARAVTTRTPAALDPLPERTIPSEIVPLVRSLNDLLSRLARALKAQREFVADAAHELRTPLAALSLQLQLAERAADPASRADAFADLKRGLERATHAVQQLLTLARQEPGAGERPWQVIDLVELVATVLTHIYPLAEAKGIDLGATPAIDHCFIDGDREGLHILVDNLVSNAIRYTPPAGKIDLATGVENGKPFLAVHDSGSGIPPEERERVFDRFYRRASTEEPGSGLGLAIVKTVAQRHCAAIDLGDSPLGGLCVRVQFPAAGEQQAALSH